MHVEIYRLSPYERCWQLELARSLMAANYSVALEITDFELQYSPSCLFDKLSIYCVDAGTVFTNAQPPPLPLPYRLPKLFRMSLMLVLKTNHALVSAKHKN